MTENTTVDTTRDLSVSDVPATPAAAPAPVKKAAKKAPVKKAAAAKKGAKKAPAKAAKTAKKAVKKAPAAAPAAKKGGLGKPRLAVLKALAKASKPLTRSLIAEKTGIGSGFTSLLGHSDPAKREERSLLSLGLIKAEQHDIGGRDTIVYSLTAAGRKALEKGE